jgi:hypothetical protein
MRPPTKRVDILITGSDAIEFTHLKSELKMGDKQLIMMLIRHYRVQEANDITIIMNNIRRRFRMGINGIYLSRLRALSLFLNTILSRFS